MTDAKRIAIELNGLTRFALGLELTRQTIASIYEVVGCKAAAAGTSDDDRISNARR